MKTAFKVCTALLAAFWVTLVAAAAETSPAGLWKWTVQSRRGGEGFELALKLDYRDGKVTGLLLGRQGGRFSIPDAPISDASLKNGVLKFTVTRDLNGRSFTTRYEGRLEGDTLTGTYERPGSSGSEPVKSDWVAKREK